MATTTIPKTQKFPSEAAPAHAMKVRTRKKTTIKETPASQRDSRVSAFAGFDKLVKEFDGFKPASATLLNVRAVPTIFPIFDYRTKVGGLPIERFTLLHGPSGGGKTYFGIGLMLSFLMRGHPVFFIDAERTTPYAWLRKAMGPYADHPMFFAVKPSTYEDTRKQVREFLNKIKRMREQKKLPPDTSALVFLDSIKKLVPKDQFDMITREKPKKGQKPEGARSRIDQMKAGMNAAWLDELVVILDECQAAMVSIARETVDPNVTDPRAIAAGYNMRTGGGSHAFYDASLDLQSKLVKAYGKKVKGADGKEKLMPYGDLHEIYIKKSKVSGKGEVYRARAQFHISNGVWTPEGFDTARDLVVLARTLDVISGTRSVAFGRSRWRSEDIAVRSLSQDRELFAKVDAATRACFELESVRA